MGPDADNWNNCRTRVPRVHRDSACLDSPRDAALHHSHSLDRHTHRIRTQVRLTAVPQFDAHCPSTEAPFVIEH